MNVHDVYDCIDTRPYADDDHLLNDFVEDILHHVSWKLFQHQTDFVCMAHEREDGIPLLKDNVIEVIDRQIDSELSWLYGYMTTRLLMSYRLNNIDLGDEGTQWLRDDLGDELYLEWESRARKHIYDEYARILGEEKAEEYFKKIGRLHYKDGDVSDLIEED